MPSNLTAIKLKYTAYNLALLLFYAAGLRLALFLASLSPEWLSGLIAFIYFPVGILGGFFYFEYLAVKKYEALLTSLTNTEPARLKLDHALGNCYFVNMLLFILSSVLSPIFSLSAYAIRITFSPANSLSLCTTSGVYPCIIRLSV